MGTVWLIASVREVTRLETEYLAVVNNSLHFEWTTDRMKALRFANRKSAEQVMGLAMFKGQKLIPVEVTLPEEPSP